MHNIIGKEFWNANQGREVGVPGCVLHHRKVELLRWVLHHEEYSYSVRWLHLAGCMQGTGGQ